MPNNINQLWTINEVAVTLNLGASTIWRKVKNGSFPLPIKIGGCTRWHQSEIEAYIAELTTEQRKSGEV